VSWLGSEECCAGVHSSRGAAPLEQGAKLVSAVAGASSSSEKSELRLGEKGPRLAGWFPCPQRGRDRAWPGMEGHLVGTQHGAGLPSRLLGSLGSSAATHIWDYFLFNGKHKTHLS